MRILLIGNPNTGKSTLFNALTGGHRAVGNRPGVTVEKGTRTVLAGRRRLEVTDLPGIYSLSPESRDTRVAVLETKENYDCIFAVLDETALLRGLPLLTEISALGKPTVIVLTLSDEAKKRGVSVDTEALEKITGMPVYKVSGKTGEGVEGLLRFDIPPAAAPIRFSPAVILERVQGSRRNAILERSDKMDSLLTGKRLALPVFLFLMGLLFFTVFGAPGILFSELLHNLIFGPLYAAIEGLLTASHASPVLQSFLLDGVFGGVLNVVSFLPQIALLFFLLAALEESGYLSRVAFLLSPYTGKIGLDGRAAISFLLGFGCTVPAVFSTRIMEDERERKKAVFLLPFLSCSARATVYGAFISAFFPKCGFLLGFFLYLVGILLLILTAALLRLSRPTESDYFILEFPPYRLPSLRSVLRVVGERCLEFLKKAGSVIFIVSAVLWTLASFTPTLSYALCYEESLLYAVGSLLSPIFAPLGFGNPVAASAILSGIGAKESVLSVFGILFPGKTGEEALRATFTAPSALSFLVFLSLSLPCIATLSAIRREGGGARRVIVFLLYSFLCAYAAAFLTYRAALLFIH